MLKFDCDGDIWCFDGAISSIDHLLADNYFGGHIKKFDTIIIDNMDNMYHKNITLDHSHINNIVLKSTSKKLFHVFKLCNTQLWANENISALYVKSPHQLINIHDMKKCKKIYILNTT